MTYVQLLSITWNRPSQPPLSAILGSFYQKWPGRTRDPGSTVPPKTDLASLSTRPAGPLDLTVWPFRPPSLTLPHNSAYPLVRAENANFNPALGNPRSCSLWASSRHGLQSKTKILLLADPLAEGKVLCGQLACRQTSLIASRSATPSTYE
jgi:hypothetical protein